MEEMEGMGDHSRAECLSGETGAKNGEWCFEGLGL